VNFNVKNRPFKGFKNLCTDLQYVSLKNSRSTSVWTQYNFLTKLTCLRRCDKKCALPSDGRLPLN
jgi:hypothetical protein